MKPFFRPSSTSTSTSGMGTYRYKTTKKGDSLFRRGGEKHTRRDAFGGRKTQKFGGELTGAGQAVVGAAGAAGAGGGYAAAKKKRQKVKKDSTSAFGIDHGISKAFNSSMFKPVTQAPKVGQKKAKDAGSSFKSGMKNESPEGQRSQKAFSAGQKTKKFGPAAAVGGGAGAAGGAAASGGGNSTGSVGNKNPNNYR